MLLIFSIGFRNIRRNMRRSILTVSIIAFGLTSLMFTDAFMSGLKKNMLASQTDVFSGHGQIHHKNYKESFEVENYINDIDSIIKILEKSPLVEAYTPRVFLHGMLSSSYESKPVQVFGLSFSSEMNVSKIKKFITEGEYPKNQDAKVALVGEKLAKSLNIEVGQKIVLTAAQVGSGDLYQDMYKVTGIFEFKNRVFDTSTIFVPISEIQKNFNIVDGAHQVALRFYDIKNSNKPLDEIRKGVENFSSKYEGWEEFLPMLKSIFDLNDNSIFITSTILFIFVFLSIMNTLLMSIFERTYEFGVLKAIGTKEKDIFLMVMSECLSLGFFGVVFGSLLGVSLIYFFSLYGFDYRDLEFGGSTIIEPIYTQFSLKQFTLLPLIIILMSFVSGLYPARFASKLKILDAMKKTF